MPVSCYPSENGWFYDTVVTESRYMIVGCLHLHGHVIGIYTELYKWGGRQAGKAIVNL